MPDPTSGTRGDQTCLIYLHLIALAGHKGGVSPSLGPGPPPATVARLAVHQRTTNVERYFKNEDEEKWQWNLNERQRRGAEPVECRRTSLIGHEVSPLRSLAILKFSAACRAVQPQSEVIRAILC